MGLLSTIKQIYYNSKFNKATALIDNKRYNEAEIILVNLIPNHPEAVTELARMYLVQAEIIKNQALYYQKALNCESKLIIGISNNLSFNELKSKILNSTYQHFNTNYDQHHYKKALEFSTLLIGYRKDDIVTARHFQCLLDFVISLGQDQINESESILTTLYNECKGKKHLSEISEATKNQIKNLALKYSSIKKNDRSNSLLLIILEDDLEAKCKYIENSISNIQLGQTDKKREEKLLSVIKSIADKSIAIKYLESILNEIPNAEILYSIYIIDTSNNLIKDGNYTDAIAILTDAYKKCVDVKFIDHLISIAQKQIGEKGYNSAIALLTNLISKHSDAEPLLSKCYVELSVLEKVNDSRRELLLKALKFKTDHSKLFNSKLYDEIFSKVITCLIEVSYKYGEISYFTDSYGLLDKILIYEPQAINVFIKIKLLEINCLPNIDKQINLYLETLADIKKKIIEKPNLKDIQFESLVSELIRTSLKKYSHTDLDEAIKGLQLIKNEIVKNKIPSPKFEDALFQLDVELAERCFNNGVQFEIQNKLEDALHCYEILINKYSNISDLHNQGLIRKYIILFKNNSIEKIKDHNSIIEKFLEKQKRSKLIIDLAFRFSVHLIKNGSHDIAVGIIENYLPSNSNTVRFLKDLCQNEKIKSSKIILSKLNQRFEKINSGELGIDETSKILSELSEIDKKCSSSLYDIKDQILGIKQNLIDYAIYTSFKEENYTECFNYIKKYESKYFKSNILLRNMAIASLGIIETGGMKKDSYKELISILLTAIYCNRLFVDSLNYTSWDDNYTFSLSDSLGCLVEEDIATIPDNVNFDEIDSVNISIGNVQKSLLEILEKSINADSYDDGIKNLALTFFEEEKDAISSLYGLAMDSSIMGCTPYFMQTQDEFNSLIKNALLNELKFSDINVEDVLKVGIRYNIEGKEFKDYSDSIILKNKAVEVAKAKNYTQAKLIFTGSNVKKIKRYEELLTSLSNDLREIFKSLISNEADFEDVISIYLMVCAALKDPGLDYMVSNSANRICISKLNEDSIKKHKALNMLVEVYQVTKENTRLNENIQAILNSSIFDIIIEGDKGMRDVFFALSSETFADFEKGIIEELEENLDALVISGKNSELISFTSTLKSKTSLKNAVNRVIIRAKDIQVNIELSKIIDKLNSQSISDLQGFKLTYQLYKSNKDHKRVCENLVILCGNMIHAHVISGTSFVISGTSLPQQVTNILDELKINRSIVFVQSARVLADQRREILNSLPITTRNLLIGYVPGQSLNSEGEALKKGLRYMELLSGTT